VLGEKRKKERKSNPHWVDGSTASSFAGREYWSLKELLEFCTHRSLSS